MSNLQINLCDLGIITSVNIAQPATSECCDDCDCDEGDECSDCIGCIG